LRCAPPGATTLTFTGSPRAAAAPAVSASASALAVFPATLGAAIDAMDHDPAEIGPHRAAERVGLPARQRCVPLGVLGWLGAMCRCRALLALPARSNPLEL